MGIGLRGCNFNIKTEWDDLMLFLFLFPFLIFWQVA